MPAKDDKTVARIVGRSVRLERVIRAPPAKVWKAWSSKESIEEWFWPVGRGKAREFDFRPGGRLVMAHAEQPWVATWRFKDIVPEQRIVIEDLWDDGSGHVATGTIQFQGVPEGTRLVVDHGPFPEKGPYRLEDALGGFRVVMERLAGLLDGPAGSEHMPSDREILIVREYDAVPERVWAAWTDPQQLARWYGPDGFRITTHAWDLRPGGVWRFTMHGPDGADYPNWIRYKDIAPPRRLAYDHGGSKPDAADFEGFVTIEPLPGGRTRLSLRSVFPSKEARDHVVREYHAIEGGKQTLARLAEHLAKAGA